MYGGRPDMYNDGRERLTDQDLQMVNSVLIEGEEYLDSLHNDGERTFVIATNMRVAKCFWDYDSGLPSLKGTKSLRYGEIKAPVIALDKARAAYIVSIESPSGESVELIRMPEHFSQEIKRFASIISEGVQALKRGGQTHYEQFTYVDSILANLDTVLKLAQLRQLGVLSEEEYQFAKSKILRRR